jgi:cytochrome c biogenesis protein CcmG, thiol:disulfide interchange protein DsbE
MRAAGLGLLAFLAATVGSPVVSRPEDGSDSNESCTVSVPSGARLEWRRRKGKAAQLKVKKVEAGSAAAGLGYRPEDEILSIASVAISDKDLDTSLGLSRERGAFRIRRKQEELELPPLFEAGRVLESVDHSLKPGDRAPSVPVFLKDGSVSDVLEVLEGRVVLVNFWAHWCRPCLEEMPMLGRLQKTYGNRGLVVLALNVDEDAGNAMKYVDGSPPGVQVIWAGGLRGRQADSYRVEGIPLNVLVHRNRRIAQVRVGYGGAQHEASLSRGIEALLDATELPVLVVRK